MSSSANGGVCDGAEGNRTLTLNNCYKHFNIKRETYCMPGTMNSLLKFL